jgi:hypothetical protein
MKEETHINNTLDLSEHSCYGLADDRNCLEQSSLSDEYIKQNLMDTDKLLLIVSHHILR